MEKIKQWVRGKVKIADKGMDLFWTRRLSMGMELQLGKATVWGGGGSRFGPKEHDRIHRKKKSRRKGQAIVGWDAVVTLEDVQGGNGIYDKAIGRVLSFLSKKSGCDLGQSVAGAQKQ